MSGQTKPPKVTAEMRAEARRLRAEEGLSVRAIAERLGVGKSHLAEQLATDAPYKAPAPRPPHRPPTPTPPPAVAVPAADPESPSEPAEVPVPSAALARAQALLPLPAETPLPVGRRAIRLETLARLRRLSEAAAAAGHYPSAIRALDVVLKATAPARARGASRGKGLALGPGGLPPELALLKPPPTQEEVLHFAEVGVGEGVTCAIEGCRLHVPQPAIPPQVAAIERPEAAASEGVPLH